MRAISEALLSRLQASWQTSSNNAEPSMEIIVRRSEGELFIVETIHTKTGLTDIDVALKRRDTTNEPDEAYIIYIHAGVASVAKTTLSYDPAVPWELLLELRAAKAVAIEFDGYWVRDVATMKYNFTTTGEPWLFWVDSANKLQAQHGDNTATLFELAADAVQIAAIRGWIPADAVSTQDQGLIVAYTKTDGKLYYRNYCLQENLTRSWETWRQVPNLPESIDNISLFRTNDFRVGFLAEAAGNLHWTISQRNWAGMSIPPDTLRLVEVGITVSITAIGYSNHTSQSSRLELTVTSIECNLGLPNDAQSILATGFINAQKLYIEYSSPLINLESWAGHFSIATYTIINVEFDSMANRLLVTVDNAKELRQFFGVTVNYDGLAGIRSQIRLGNKPVLSAFAISIAGTEPNAPHKLLLSEVAIHVSYTAITRQEHIAGSSKLELTNVGITAAVTQVAYAPI